MKGNNLERVCIACGEMKPKAELLRFVKTAEGILPDETGKLQGRGAYICNDPNCFQLAIRKKSFKKAFRGEDSEKAYETLRSMIHE